VKPDPKNHSFGQPTLVACLTPPGRAALATLSLHGPEAWLVARELFHPRQRKSLERLPETPQAKAFWLGRFGHDLADEVVLAVRQVDPVPWIEVHAHGGREVIRLLLELLVARGLVAVTWPEFLRHTMADHLQAEAAIALAHAPTVRTASILLDQFHGALTRALSVVVANLEKDPLTPNPSPTRGEGSQNAATQAVRATCNSPAPLSHSGRGVGGEGVLAELAERAPLGRHLIHPWQVVVAGAPNVGKSSLVNALAGYQRSIVAPTPGTTRDVVATRLAVDGWPIELADTAGLREDAGVIEEQGIFRARKKLAEADLVLWVLDAATVPVWPSDKSDRLHLVVNRIDLPAAWDLSIAEGALRVSAHTGEGIPELVSAMGTWLVPRVPPAGAAVPFTPALCGAVEEALKFLREGQREQARQILTRQGISDQGE
jgi:tRNA modification GTPase